MKRGQVFVRAEDENGRRGTVDVLDLDEESFRVLVIDTMVAAGLLVGIIDELVDGKMIKLRVKKGVVIE